MFERFAYRLHYRTLRLAAILMFLALASTLTGSVLMVSLLETASAADDGQPLATLDVCLTGCPFAIVQDAINAATPGDLIRIGQGTYNETIMVAKTITLQGGYSGPPDWQYNLSAYVTVLDGHGVGPVVQVTSGFSPTINGFTITNGRADNGGGIYISYSSPTLNNNTVISNTASSTGGGVYIIGKNTLPTLNGNWIIGNTTSNNGGGVFIDDYSSPILVNNVIARNYAWSNGGGIYIDYYSTPSIINNTIVANNLGSSWANEGIYIYNNSSPTIVNNIIVTHSYGIRSSTSPTITLDYNDVWACTVVCYSGVTPGPHDISADPRFVNPGSGDHHLRSDSPAIDAGTNAEAPASDFEGDPRPLDGNGDGTAIADMGADETAAPPADRICLWHDDCWWLLGVNYPWLGYGHDFGQAAWPIGSWSHDGASNPISRQRIKDDFEYLRSKGVHVVRWFLFADGRASPEFDSQGYVTGFDSYFYSDVDTVLSLACQYDLHLIPVLLDYTWLKPAEWVGGVQLFGHSDVITDTAERQSFFDNALRPLLERYGSDRSIIAWDVMNEPELAVCGLGDIEPCVPLSTMQSFVREAVSYIHNYASQDATVGSAQGQWLSHWQGMDLDFYQFHHYDGMGQQPPFVPYSGLGLDKPAILGEFPTASTTITVTRYLSTTWDNGYAGALAWSLNGNDSASDFRGIADEFQHWSQAHDPDVGIPRLCPVTPPVIHAHKVSNGIELHWTQTQSGIVRYEVWRSTDPYFVPGDQGSQKFIPDPPTPGEGNEATYTDTFGEPPLTNRYYVVVAVGAGEATSPPSNRVAAFHFTFVPGAQ